jgi:hypothetical protein
VQFLVTWQRLWAPGTDIHTKSNVRRGDSLPRRQKHKTCVYVACMHCRREAVFSGRGLDDKIQVCRVERFNLGANHGLSEIDNYDWPPPVANWFQLTLDCATLDARRVPPEDGLRPRRRQSVRPPYRAGPVAETVFRRKGLAEFIAEFPCAQA